MGGPVCIRTRVVPRRSGRALGVPMNADVERAFAALEAHGTGFEGALEKYSAALWRDVDRLLPGYGPSWYREMTQRFSVGGANFHYPVDPDRDYMGECTIHRPAWLPEFIERVNVYFRELFQQGFFCFADGGDGDLWLFRNDAVDDPPVFFFELSSYGGGPASADNGMIAPSLTLSQLLRHGAAWKAEEDQHADT